MLKKVSPLVLMMTVAACSTTAERRQANGSDNYVNEKNEPKLIVPNGLKQPAYKSEFRLPTLSKDHDSQQVGSALDIRPPLQVLALADGTRVEDNSKGVKVLVETVNNNRDLKGEIESTIESFLASRNIRIVEKTENPLTFKTNWVENTKVVDSSLFGSDTGYTLRQRYEFDVNIKPHGRTGDIVVKLIDHQVQYNGEEQGIKLTDTDMHRYTVDMLNSAISYLRIERIKAIKAARVEQSLGMKVEFKAEQKTAYWLVNAPNTKVWDRLRIVLPELGFEIVDMDVSKNLYYIDYKNETGFWSSLWGDSNKIELKDGSYRLTLEPQGDSSTKIIIRDIENKALSLEQLQSLNKPLMTQMAEKRT
ncbi:outer membrane protein assembly factor BamC [Parashewanella curva]|uniref:Outer membrane protein assembly factor BamC n=1 Tax=Parashewanella curva TaxID=2338552 RepID=A0A3L8Q0S2_9GAMM|nr:outer membrane protein assembly factor BamC [Parashewanella curva]RLV61231.1 outer membrane protein assembly factor BamC [Parashewanella curva]